MSVKEQGKSHCASSAGGEGDGVREGAKSLIMDNKHTRQSRGEERSGPWQTEMLDCGFQCVLQAGAGRSHVAGD